MNSEQIVQEIREQIARRKQLPIEEVRPDRELIRDLGLDSLDYAAVVVGVEAAMGGELNESAVDWLRVRTIRDLGAALLQHVTCET